MVLAPPPVEPALLPFHWPTVVRLPAAQARWSHDAHPAGNPPPTAVLVHGILGNRKNMSNFAKMLVEVG